MKFCSKCGHEIVDEAVVCPNCGCAVAATNQPMVGQAPDEVSVGLCFLAFFVPLFGIIYWPVKHKEAPKRARACGITGIVSWGLWIILSMAMMSCAGSIMAGILASL